MDSLIIALSCYAFTIVFAMLIACAIPGLAWMVKKMKLDEEQPADLSVPSSNSMKEEEALAVVIAVARAQKK